MFYCEVFVNDLYKSLVFVNKKLNIICQFYLNRYYIIIIYD